MRFLGFRRDMPSVFAACDVLIHPARYEAYGLARARSAVPRPAGDREAAAGVAERYPADLGQLLLQDPESADRADRATCRLARGRDHRRTRRRVRREAARAHLGSHGARDRGLGAS